MDAEHYRLRDFLTRPRSRTSGTRPGRREAQHCSAGRPAGPTSYRSWSTETRRIALRRSSASPTRGRDRDAPRHDHYDFVVIGCGPAGLAAAVYAASDGLKPSLFVARRPGRPGVLHRQDRELLRLPRRDRRRRARPPRRPPGRGIRGRADVPERDRGSRINAATAVAVIMESGHEVTASVMLAATGMDWRRLDLEGLDELHRPRDLLRRRPERGAQCAGQTSSWSARETRPARRRRLRERERARDMLVRGDRLSKSMSAYLIERIEAHPLIDVRFETAADGAARGRRPARGRHVHRPQRQSETEAVDGFPLHRRLAAQRVVPREHVLTDKRGSS